jgi:hypothetical protein
MSNLHDNSSSCESCQYYRPQASFVDAYKDFDRNPPREPLMKSLLELRKDETHLQENEMELQLELLMTEQRLWPTRPRFAPLCVAGGRLSIPAAKNADERCKDYIPALNRQGRACRTCRFLIRPETKIGDRQKMPTGAGGSQETAFYRQINKEQDDADAMSQALEMEQSFYGDGSLPAVFFLPSCGAQVNNGKRLAAPFCNLRNDCAEHSPHVTLPNTLLEIVKQSEGSEDEVALEYTLRLARMVASVGIECPAEFMAEWAKDDPQFRLSAMEWTSSCVYGRWAVEAPKPSSAEKLPSHPLVKFLPNTAGGTAKRRPPQLQPYIAGCDAYEWGLLAALSKKTDASAALAAGVICQQLAEFLVTVLSPLEALFCVDAANALINPQLFAPRTVDLVQSFIRRLLARAETLRLAAQTDLQTYCEEFAAGISYKVGVWLALPMRDPMYLAKLDAIDAELGKQARQLIAHKFSEARSDGERLLSACGALVQQGLSPQDRVTFLNNLLASNNDAVDRDQKDEETINSAAVDIMINKVYPPAMANMPLGNVSGPFAQLAGNLGLPVQPTPISLAKSIMAQVYGRIFDLARAEANPRRRVLATLFILRGINPVTPTALSVWNRQPEPGRVPEALDEALWDPAANTVEAFHWERFKSQESTCGFLTAGRRVGTPCFRTSN